MPTVSITTMPSSIGSIPLSRLIKVDFPEPFGPTTQVIHSLKMDIESWSTALTAPKCFEIALVSSAKVRGSSLVLTAGISRPGPAAGTA